MMDRSRMWISRKEEVGYGLGEGGAVKKTLSEGNPMTVASVTGICGLQNAFLTEFPRVH